MKIKIFHDHVTHTMLSIYVDDDVNAIFFRTHKKVYTRKNVIIASNTRRNILLRSNSYKSLQIRTKKKHHHHHRDVRT